MEEKKNIPTVEGEAITPEAPAADIPGTDAPSPDLTAGAPPQEQAGVTVSEPGDVVVSFDKIEELMAERRAAARDTVEQAEPAAPEVAAPVVEQAEPPTPEAPAPGQPEKAAEQAQEEKPQEEVAAEQKKPRRGRPPKAEKAEQAAPEADKEQTAAKPRRGRPPKADKAAPDEAQPPKPRDKVSRSKKAAPAKEESPTPEPVAVSGNTAPAAEIPAEPKEPAPPPRPVEEGKLVYLKLSELHPFHTFRPHPFKVTDDAKMQETVASIKANGVMDIQLNMNGGESPLSMKADFLLSLCELILGGKEGLQPIERTVIDRCVRQVYREMALGLENAKTPLLQDLYEELLKQPEPEAKRVATALELYCTGSLNLFNHHTNVQTSNRVVCIVLKGMGENLRKIAMHITNEFVTQAVDENYRAGVATWCYFDEFHVLLRDQLTASYFVAVWKMLRKKGCVPSALTQNVKDLLASAEISNILDNTDFMVLLSQAQSDRAILAKQLGISEHQLSYITHSNAGEGLLFYGNVTIPFIDRFPRGEIYDLLTTRPEDMAHERKDE